MASGLVGCTYALLGFFLLPDWGRRRASLERLRLSRLGGCGHLFDCGVGWSAWRNGNLALGWHAPGQEKGPQNTEHTLLKLRRVAADKRARQPKKGQVGWLVRLHSEKPKLKMGCWPVCRLTRASTLSRPLKNASQETAANRRGRLTRPLRFIDDSIDSGAVTPLSPLNPQLATRRRRCSSSAAAPRSARGSGCSRRYAFRSGGWNIGGWGLPNDWRA